jgi:hypothetical protein
MRGSARTRTQTWCFQHWQFRSERQPNSIANSDPNSLKNWISQALATIATENSLLKFARDEGPDFALSRGRPFSGMSEGEEERHGHFQIGQLDEVGY